MGTQFIVFYILYGLYRVFRIDEKSFPLIRTSILLTVGLFFLLGIRGLWLYLSMEPLLLGISSIWWFWFGTVQVIITIILDVKQWFTDFSVPEGIAIGPVPAIASSIITEVIVHWFYLQ